MKSWFMVLLTGGRRSRSDPAQLCMSDNQSIPVQWCWAWILQVPPAYCPIPDHRAFLSLQNRRRCCPLIHTAMAGNCTYCWRYYCVFPDVQPTPWHRLLSVPALLCILHSGASNLMTADNPGHSSIQTRLWSQSAAWQTYCPCHFLTPKCKGKELILQRFTHRVYIPLPWAIQAFHMLQIHLLA